MKGASMFIVAVAWVLGAQAFTADMTSSKRVAFPQVKEGSRIIGGSEAALGQFPWAAAVFSDDSVFCGGSLISERAVLTAAHCIDRWARFVVHLGCLRAFDESEQPGALVVETENKVVHELFNIEVNFNYDIGLLIFYDTVPAQRYIAPIRLPSRSQATDSFAGLLATTLGWGTTDDIAPFFSEDLRYVEVLVTSEAQCQSYWGDKVVTPCHVCAATDNGGICSGDAGTSLAVKELDDDFTLIGVASFGSPFGCEQPEPNIYGRVTCYLDWLEQNAPGVVIQP